MGRDELLSLLENPRQSGVYRLPLNGQEAVKQAARVAGFACLDVNLEDAGSIGSALERLGRDLDFPDWYGRNLDALKDCLTDFSWCEAAGYMLIIRNAERLLVAAPEAFDALNEVFAAAIAEWRSQDYPLWVFYDLRADERATLPTLA
ncbi:MAG: barstar family protein [Candidatus Accumulibacter sp.]|jgi:RNAse (barnase) inhibitor barstar|uniref:barstar family protein n=1 Tax=Accumulibacter sp. TaxID=2053492 RepID=UPI001A56B75C|nr:barstar family protein [Accumulibacter sp.]MBL8393775.1 barstar family protein [Accumulibacter sp.]